MYLRPVLYPSNDERLDEGMHVWANLTIRRHRERKEGGGSGEQVVILVFLVLDCVGEALHFPDWSWRKG